MIQTAKTIGRGVGAAGSIGVPSVPFSTTSRSHVPNDQDRLGEEITDLAHEYNETEYEYEELVKKIRESERLYEEDEGETELSKELQDKSEAKDDLSAKYYSYKDHALFVNKDEREDKSLTLELIKKSAKMDIETLQSAKEQLYVGDDYQDQISDLLDKVSNTKDRAEKLLEEWHENDLNFIRPSSADNPESSQSQESSLSQNSSQDTRSFPQDSSDLTQTDFSPFDDVGSD